MEAALLRARNSVYETLLWDIAVFESREEAEGEAARLTAKMNSDPSCKAKFAYEARELPPALLYRRAA
jgi:hypothetical protein